MTSCEKYFLQWKVFWFRLQKGFCSRSWQKDLELCAHTHTHTHWRTNSPTHSKDISLNHLLSHTHSLTPFSPTLYHSLTLHLSQSHPRTRFIWFEAAMIKSVIDDSGFWLRLFQDKDNLFLPKLRISLSIADFLLNRWHWLVSAMLVFAKEVLGVIEANE